MEELDGTQYYTVETIPTRNSGSDSPVAITNKTNGVANAASTRCFVLPRNSTEYPKLAWGKRLCEYLQLCSPISQIQQYNTEYKSKGSHVSIMFPVFFIFFQL